MPDCMRRSSKPENTKKLNPAEISEIKEELKKQHIAKIEDVFYAQWLNGEFYLLKFK